MTLLKGFDTKIDDRVVFPWVSVLRAVWCMRIMGLWGTC